MIALDHARHGDGERLARDLIPNNAISRLTCVLRLRNVKGVTRINRNASSAKTSLLEKSTSPRLHAFCSKLSSFQRELFDTFWNQYQEHGKWPRTREVHSKLGTHEVRDSLRAVGGDIVRELTNVPNDTYELSLIGVLMTSDGETYRRLLVRYLEFLREQFISNPSKVDFSDKEIQKGLSLPNSEIALLGRLLRLEHSLGFGGSSEISWTIRSPKEVEYLPRRGPLDAEFEAWLFRRFEHRPVFAEEFRRYWDQRSQSAPPTLSGEHAPQVYSPALDALKRRYQVFVSSTYDDLKEERLHVIQALLETKCIPVGMELFPAASIDQWKLIQRVIDECDYYIVVIAGRYGSLNDAHIGYTEMEFDYALTIGKPVIGFYHRNPESLPQSKCEKTDAGRERLKSFTDKVKRRLCRPWNSSAELGSAVKSAIIHELEFNPQPGWVRADAVTSSEHVDKLKQRIADLEERLKKGGHRTAVHKNPEMNVALHFDVIVSRGNETDDELLEIPVNFSWDELFATCTRLFKDESASSEDLRSEFERSISGRVKAEVMKQSPESEFLQADIPREEFERVIHTFVAEKLLKVARGGWSYKDGAWLIITDKGLHRLSEIKVSQMHAAA